MSRGWTIAMTVLAGLSATAPGLAGPGFPHGWSGGGAGYEFGTEHVEGSVGKQSAYVKAKPDANASGFGTFTQGIKADDYIGQRVRVSARLKSTDASGVQLWMRVDGSNGKVLAFYNMSDRPVKGTTDWKRYDVVLDVPPGSTNIYYGFFLAGGRGEGWADAFTLEKVDRSVPVSAEYPPGLNKAPVNMNFDQ